MTCCVEGFKMKHTAILVCATALVTLCFLFQPSQSQQFTFPIQWDNSSSNIVNSGPVRKQLVINVEDVIEDGDGSKYIISMTNPFDDIDGADSTKNYKK